MVGALVAGCQCHFVLCGIESVLRAAAAVLSEATMPVRHRFQPRLAGAGRAPKVCWGGPSRSGPVNNYAGLARGTWKATTQAMQGLGVESPSFEGPRLSQLPLAQRCECATGRRTLRGLTLDPKPLVRCPRRSPQKTFKSHNGRLRGAFTGAS